MDISMAAGSALLFFLYFLPTVVAWKKTFVMQVFLLNFLLGWTVLGWIIALIWAAKNEN
jgi:uncharacterized membrane protein YqaE (UPF0057 family)